MKPCHTLSRYGPERSGVAGVQRRTPLAQGCGSFTASASPGYASAGTHVKVEPTNESTAEHVLRRLSGISR